MAKRSTKRSSPPPGSFEALRQFFSGYLHQDFREEYDSPVDAAKEFCADATAEDIAALREDWKKWWTASQRLPLPQIQASIRGLGAAWSPQSPEEINEVGDTLEKATRR